MPEMRCQSRGNIYKLASKRICGRDVKSFSDSLETSIDLQTFPTNSNNVPSFREIDPQGRKHENTF